MVLSRQLLFRSAFWEIARPRHPLTAGHVVVRLSDPSIAFSEPSAKDWLRCHNLARAALGKVLGADRCVVMFAHRWHPLGPAVGEPAAESSTPTFHLFARWHGEPTTPGSQLGLPAHRRDGVPEQVLADVDPELRQSIRCFAGAGLPGVDPAHPDLGTVQPEPEEDRQRGPGSGVVPPGGRPPLVADADPSGRHRIFEPVAGARSVAELLPWDLLGIADALGGLPLAGGVSGYSCIAVEAGPSGQPLRIHAVARSGAEEGSPLLDVFRLPEVSLALL